MATRYSKSYFFTGSDGAGGILYRTENRPPRTVWQILFDSIPFINDSGDTAKTTEAGHIKLSTDVKAIDRDDDSGDGHARTILPHMLPDVVNQVLAGSVVDSTVIAEGINVSLLTKTVGATTKRDFLVNAAYDGVTIDIDGFDKLIVKDGGIGTLQLADNSVTLDKIYHLTSGSLIYGTPGGPVEFSIGANATIMISDGIDIHYRSITGDCTLINTGVLTINDDAVGLTELYNITSGSLIVGGAGNPTELAVGLDTQILISNAVFPVYRTMSGDCTIINTGAITIANNAVTNAKMANLQRGYIKVGDAGNNVSDLDANNNGYMLIGDGNDINSVQITGDISITNAGDVTVLASLLWEAGAGTLSIVHKGVGSTSAGNYNVVGGHTNAAGGDKNGVFGEQHIVNSNGNIVGGAGNDLSNSSERNGVFGSANVLNNISSHNLVAGVNSDIDNGSKYNLVIGSGQDIDNTTYSVIGGRSCIVNAGNCGGIFGRSHNVTADYNLVGGYDHTITADKNLVGGWIHNVSGIENVVGGNHHTVAGHMNGVFSSANICSGNENGVFGNNQAVSGNRCLVAGSNHDVLSDNNLVSGNGNNTSDKIYGSIIGHRGKMFHHHENVYAANMKAVSGDRQGSDLVAFCSTTGAGNTADCLIGGPGGTGLNVEDGAVYRAELRVVAVDYTSLAGGGNIQGTSTITLLLKNNTAAGGALTVVGNSVTNNMQDVGMDISYGAGTLQVSVNIVGSVATLRCTDNAASNAIEWIIDIHLTRIKGTFVA